MYGGKDKLSSWSDTNIHVHMYMYIVYVYLLFVYLYISPKRFLSLNTKTGDKYGHNACIVEKLLIFKSMKTDTDIFQFHLNQRLTRVCFALVHSCKSANTRFWTS